MDPDAALAEWAAAVLSEDKERATEAWEALARWLTLGGFEPRWGTKDMPNGNPRRDQFLAYNPATGRLDREVDHGT